jgi:hypothetical protein
MAELSLDCRIAISEDAVFRELDGEAVILQLESGVFFGLDPVGTRLWQLIDTHGQLGAVLSVALQEFDAAPEVLERDLLRLVSELEEKQLVVVS